MEHILTLFYTLVFLVIIFKVSFFRSEKIAAKYFGYVFVLKILTGMFLSYLYRAYFNGGDTFVFFNDANKLYEVLKTHPLDFIKIVFGISNDPSLDVYYKQMAGWENYEYFYNDSRTIIRINALIRIFSFGYYNVHVVFFSFMSLVGLSGIYKIFCRIAPGKEKELFAAAFLIPSVLFWSSGILKEGILMFGLGLLLYSFIKITAGSLNLKYFFSMGLGMLLLIYLKIYVLAILIPGMIAYWWSMKTNCKNVFMKFLLIYFLFSIALVNLKLINPNFNFSEIIYWKQHNSIGYAKFMKSGSYIEPPLLNPEILSILKNSPRALFNVFILPDWNHIHNPFALLAAFENFIIILIIFMAIIFFERLQDFQKPLFFLSAFFVILLFVLIGLTTPIIGAMVRYKVPALPFLLSALAIIFNKEKFIRLLKKQNTQE